MLLMPRQMLVTLLPQSGHVRLSRLRLHHCHCIPIDTTAPMLFNDVRAHVQHPSVGLRRIRYVVLEASR